MLVTEVTILRLTLVALGVVLLAIVAGLIALRLGSPRQIAWAGGLSSAGAIVAALVIAARFEGNMTAQRIAEGLMFAAMAALLAIAGRGAVVGAAGVGSTAEFSTLVLQFVVLITAYGVLIPSSAPRTLMVCVAMAVLPLAVLLSSLDQLSVRGLIGPLVLLALAVLVAVAASFLISAFRKLAVETRILNMYDLTEMIGEGGMGQVWRAEHQRLARPAAIKLIRREILGENREHAERAMARFELEARATANLRSPNTVEVYDFGTTGNGTFFYVMEFLDGFDLETMVDKFGPLPAARVIHLIRQVCESIGDAHENGLIHRDIKPANISVSRMGLAYDYVKVLDFGLVKPTGEGGSVVASMDTAVTGTPAYMAPEMVTGDAEVDRRADIYAIGCVAYWMLSGCLVFDESSPMKMAVAHASYPPVPPSKRTDETIAPSVDSVILRCLEKDPADRYQTVRELSVELAACDVGPAWTDEQAESWWRQCKPAESMAG